MARIKTEFKAHYFARNGYPLRNRLIGSVPRLSKLVAALPEGARVANVILRLPLTRRLMGHLGLAKEREFPDFAAETFSKWFWRRPPRRSGSPRMLLFNDTWTEYNHPELGRAAVEVLEAAGYEVILETQRACCGRPLLTSGFIEPVKQMARHNVDLLTPFVEAGLSIVGLEPSCILSFRDEYPALVDAGRRDAATRLGQACLTIDEFLYQLLAQGKFPVSLPVPKQPSRRDQGQVTPAPLLFHGHCHQKALSDIRQSLAVLEAAGYQVEAIPSGCCGMAGNFGYEAEHYAISQIIARDRLIPTLEARPDLPLVANGISCREQVEHLTGRRARHLIEYVAEALSAPAS